MTIANIDLLRVRRLECELDGEYFFRYFFKQRTGAKALINWHHDLMSQALQDVIDLKIDRLIITLPPGYTKTELATINFMARGLAINPRARFLHLSYSDALTLLNSSVTRDIVKSEQYQAMWPTAIRADTNSKKLWWTESGGGVYAASMAGQVTGFRAGQMEDIDTKFTGAMIIDDPLKPDDAFTVELQKVNERYNTTAQSRLAHQKIPVIVIMQRIDYNDLAGYLLRGGSGEKWHHLNLPIEFPADNYPVENTYGIPIPYTPPGAVLWEAKHNLADIEILKAKPRVFKSQYKQNPEKGDSHGKLWDDNSIATAQSLSIRGVKSRTVVAVDPSVTSKETSDECGILVGSKYDCSHVSEQADQFSLDFDYSGIMTPTDWALKAIWAAEIHDADAIVVETNQGGDIIEILLRKLGYTGRVIGVHAKKNKYLRAEPEAALYNLKLVKHNTGLDKLETEMTDFTIQMQDSPNRLDAAVYALKELSGGAIEAGGF